MIPPSIEEKVTHLARMVASGQSVRSWAKRNHCDVEMVLAWCAAPEFNEIVDEHRMRVADHMVTGKLDDPGGGGDRSHLLGLAVRPG